MAPIASVACGHMCLFCDAPGLVPASVISDLADESAGTYVQIVTDMEIPGWVGKDTMAVLVLGNGSTQGFDRLRKELESIGATVALVSGEGMSLPEFCGFALGSMVELMAGAGIYDFADSLSSALDAALSSRERLLAIATAVAEALDGTVPSFYSTSGNHSLALAWRHIVSEAVGRPCFCGELPEFDHNELVGWSDPNAHAPQLRLVVIDGGRSEGLVSDIVGCMVEVLEENGRDVVSVDVGGDNVMSRAISGIMLAFMVTEALS